MKLRNNKRIESPRRQFTEEAVGDPVAAAAIPDQSSSSNSNSIDTIISREIDRIYAGIVSSLHSSSRRAGPNQSGQTTSDNSQVTTSRALQETLRTVLSELMGSRSSLFSNRERSADSTEEDGSEPDINILLGLELDRVLQNNVVPTTTTLTRSEKLSNMQRMTVTKDQRKDKLCCPVCQETFTSNRVVYAMRCGHVYHRNCILKWLDTNQSCPVCRIDLIKDDSVIVISDDDDDDDDEDDGVSGNNLDRIGASGNSRVTCP